ncbi:universal stress protein [Paenibacillus athensensis]|uniref:Histidine kinase n=1 Tax=Paenibacillus athensensis TaxID=1967502 RepID=A0A4Y8PYI3_9BACL|nr:universal stress protein [Paenibacillus athensensis]MCD1261242.1 universal stress protein [Paenibacillus athensensis]
MEEFRRKTPEELLASILRLRRGTLKVYVGPVSGSGKTYHMLREGHELRKMGIDVVICAVSTLQRPETIEQLGDLERVPSLRWRNNGAEYKDLNLDALLACNPEVVLVDDLAHRNRPGARFPTRLEDIRFLLGLGISVITTVNVYELAGYTELAHKLTGVEVNYSLPSDTLELADEVRLIDVTPETLLTRLAEGRLKGSPDPAVFQRGNLGVLRELALRLVADGVHESLRVYRERQGLTGPSGAAERILVSTQYHWNGSIYVRRGQQIAKRLNGELMVVTFRRMRWPLSWEAAAFRQSMVQLVDKIGGAFEELPFKSRRSLAADLLRYAAERRVTRIVMGHTKHTRWQELWQGSVVNTIMKASKHIDVFLVADRAEHEGERILPARLATDPEGDGYRRLGEVEVEARIGQIRRGRLKVYLGAAPGVGKTYTMLREGNDGLVKGIDVQIGLLETHNRKETIAQIGRLEVIPRKRTVYQGVMLEEMDTETIVSKHPEVVLVDELAHTNVPGSRHSKRYEDVLELLEAGISVITTLNVQHLESLNDAVEHITGIRVRETVPDRVLQLADEVQLVDVAPEALRQRMRDGKIYANAKVEQALSHFFQVGNLIALRELALREIADDVDERLESLERTSSLRGPWRRLESIFICVSDSPHAERLIRRGFRTAYRLKAAWHVQYVHVGPAIAEELRRRLDALERLTVSLGGTFGIAQARHAGMIADVLAAKAEEAGATQLVIGQDKRSRWRQLRQGSVVQRLIRRSRQRDVLIVADFDPRNGL